MEDSAPACSRQDAKVKGEWTVEHRHDCAKLRVGEVVLWEGEHARLHQRRQLRLGHVPNNRHAGFPAFVLAVPRERYKRIRRSADEAHGSALDTRAWGSFVS